MFNKKDAPEPNPWQEEFFSELRKLLERVEMWRRSEDKNSVTFTHKSGIKIVNSPIITPLGISDNWYAAVPTGIDEFLRIALDKKTKERVFYMARVRVDRRKENALEKLKRAVRE